MKKNVLITGASRGLGREIAVSLAARPDIGTMALTARDSAKLEMTREYVKKANPKIEVKVVEGSLSNSGDILGLIKKLKSTGTEFNVIINNAGTGVIAPLENTEDNKIEEMFFVNLLAPLLIVKHFLPELRKNRWGRVINISSISAFKPNHLLIPYTVSKSALKSLSECITSAEIKNGITCNTIVPGFMLTDMGKGSIKKSFPDYSEQNAAEIESRVANSLPSGRIIELSEVTSLIDFLLGDTACNISGEYFRVASGII